MTPGAKTVYLNQYVGEILMVAVPRPACGAARRCEAVMISHWTDFVGQAHISTGGGPYATSGIHHQ